MLATKHSKQTVTDFMVYFKELVGDAMDMVDMVIGGEGIEVQIDETKMGRRKYNRGHRVEGVWVLGGVEKTAERKVFAVPVSDRSERTLIPIIRKHVAKGSIIVTDCWKAYSSLGIGSYYGHQTVNHSKTFKDPVTGAETNTIEGNWAAIKYGIPKRNRTEKLVEPYLWEFMWRRKNNAALWDAFIYALSDVNYE